jgi:hypothetical protein
MVGWILVRHSTYVGYGIPLNDILTSKSRWREWLGREVLNMDLCTSNMSQDEGISLTRSGHSCSDSEGKEEVSKDNKSALIHDHFHLRC